MLTLKNGTAAFDSQELIKAYENDPKVLDIALEDTATAYAEMTDGDVDGWIKFMHEFVTTNTDTTEGTEEEEMNIKTCEHCGVIIGDGDDYIIDGNGKITCSDCQQDMFCCESCGNFFDGNDIVTIRDQYDDIIGFVCNDCAEAYYQQCPECGRWYTEAAFNGRETCMNCTPDVILSYHAHNPNGLEFHGCTDYSFINGYIEIGRAHV